MFMSFPRSCESNVRVEQEDKKTSTAWRVSRPMSEHRVGRRPQNTQNKEPRVQSKRGHVLGLRMA